MSDYPVPGASVISIGTRQADGTGLIRRWLSQECCANNLAAQLGEPVQEVLATREAAEAVAALSHDVPGVIVTGAGS